MKIISRLLMVLLTATLVAGGGPWLSSARDDPFVALRAMRMEGTPAHDFALPDLKGTQVSLSDFRGKVILLGFFTTA